MSQDVFPTMPGLSWSSFKRPTFSTRISSRVSGREVRSPNYVYPLWEFELTYEVLRGDAHQELQQMAGFFLARQGQYDTFLYFDPSDHTVTNQHIGVGDGVNKIFPLLRTLGEWVEPVGQAASQPIVTVNGIQTTGFALLLPNLIQFGSAPPLGQTVMVTSMTFYFVCRFLDDMQEYENFMRDLWIYKTCKFRSVKP